MEYQVGKINQLTTNGTVKLQSGESIIPLNVVNILNNWTQQYYGGTTFTTIGSVNDMDQLMNVVVVTTAKRIILDEKTVAKTEEEAKYNVGVYDVLKEKSLAFDDVTVIVQKLGNVKVKKEDK